MGVWSKVLSILVHGKLQRWTPLHAYASNGDKDKVEDLLRNEADVNAIDEDMQTPLHCAAGQGHEEIVQILIRHGADVNAKDKLQWTPLHKCVCGGHLKIVKLLINQGADVNTKDSSGLTALHKSANRGNKEIVDVLISFGGADINVKNNFGMTPLFDCLELEDKDFAKSLRNHVSYVNVENMSGWNKPICGASHCSLQIVEMLIRHGANVDVQDDLIGWTPLMVRILRDMELEDVIECLISHGTNVNKRNKYGNTALHYSAVSGKKEIVQLLIQHGAKIDPVNNDGNTPLKLAEEEGYTDIVDILRQAKPVQAGDSIFTRFFAIFAYSSSTKIISVTSSNNNGQVTEVSCESSEVTSQATGICETVEFGPGREPDTSKVKTNTTSEVDTCKQGGLSSIPSTLQTSASSNILATPPTSLSPARSTSPLAATTTSSSPPNTEPTDEIILHAQNLLKAVKRKRKSDEDGGGVCQDEDSLKLLSDQLDGNVIVINNKTVNNHYHNTYYNNNKQVSCEEVKVETSQMLDVSVGGTTHGLLHPPQGDNHVKDDENEIIHGVGNNGEMRTEGRHGHTFDVENISDIPGCHQVAEIRRRVQSLSEPVEKMFQSCMAGGEVGHNHNSDLPALQHGNPQVKVNMNVIVQPKEVTVCNTKQVNCETAQVENAEMMPVNSRCNFNYAAPPASDDEDNDDSTGDDDEEEHEVHMEDANE